jgi:GreA/GreB family transcription elongation factor
MARVEGFEPAKSEQEPVDINGNPVPVGVWGDSTTGVGVFGTSGALPPDVENIPTNIAGVEGHAIQNPGVFGRSIQDAGVSGESVQGLGVLGRSATATGVLGVTFVPSIPGQPPDASGVFGSSTTGGNGVTGFVGEATGVVGSSVEANIKEGRISIGSPIARALIGKEVGDVVTVKAPGGDIEYEIISIEYV